MSGEVQNNVWPVPKFHFAVTIGSQENKIMFQEVSGLDQENISIDYGHTGFSTIKMPGIVKFGSVTLKKGISIGDDHFLDWYKTITMNTIKRETVTIQLLDEEDKPTMTWILQNAWPTKIAGTDFKSERDEVAIETLELAHEGLTVKNG